MQAMSVLKKKFLIARKVLQEKIEEGNKDLLADELPFDLDPRFHKVVHDIHEAKLQKDIHASL